MVNEKPETALGRSDSAPTSPIAPCGRSRISPGLRYAPDNHTGADAQTLPEERVGKSPTALHKSLLNSVLPTAGKIELSRDAQKKNGRIRKQVEKRVLS